MNFVKIYVIALLVFIAIDAIWLGLIAKNLYQKEIGHLMSENVNFIAALIFYLLFLVGLVYFVINPALIDKNITKLIISGILFGIVTYSTYDLTNLATLKDWPIKVTIIDLIWGSFVSTATSLATYFIYNLMK